jgi:D-alanine--poly(phosphoribitol) ligase subunit 1
MDTYLSLVTGGTLFSVTKDHVANLRTLFEAFRASEVTTWVSTPSFATMCLIEKTFAQPMLPNLRRFLFCGETLPNDTAVNCSIAFQRRRSGTPTDQPRPQVATTSIRVDRAVLNEWNPLPVGAVMGGTTILIRATTARQWRKANAVRL